MGSFDGFSLLILKLIFTFLSYQNGSQWKFQFNKILINRACQGIVDYWGKKWKRLLHFWETWIDLNDFLKFEKIEAKILAVFKFKKLKQKFNGFQIEKIEAKIQRFSF